jgi:thioredoxin 2
VEKNNWFYFQGLKMNAAYEMTTCSGCGAKNRIPFDKIGSSAKCGKCGSTIDTANLKSKSTKKETLNDYKVRCLSCKAKNRIPSDKMGETAKCGRCESIIETAQLITGRSMMVTDQSFETLVLHSPLPVIFLCWANWCPSCQAVIPVVEQIASEWKGRIRVAKLNVDQNQMTASRFNIMSVPTLMVFDNGQFRDRLTGAVPKEQIVRAMAPFV